jgi:HNH endonuclease
MGRLTEYVYARPYSFGRSVSKHIAVAEKALGKKLPTGVIVHHVDENTLNNLPTNLVICPDEAYHKLLHRRMRAEKACGDANYQKCQYCQTWDDPARMKSVQKNDRPSVTYWHQYCRPSRAKGAK